MLGSTKIVESPRKKYKYEGTKEYIERVFQEQLDENLLFRPISEMKSGTAAIYRHVNNAAKSVGGHVDSFKIQKSVSQPGTFQITSSTSIPKDRFFISTQDNWGYVSSNNTSTTSIYDDDWLTTASSTITATAAREFERLYLGATVGNGSATSTWPETSATFTDCYNHFQAETREERLKDVVSRAIKGNLLIKTNTRQRINHQSVTPQELKARQTLRDFITEKEWRRYVTNGFLMVKGASGKWYQIFADRSHTIVWENNKRMRELCIVTDYDCPPTDHVLTIKAMIELDEKSVWDGANQYQPSNKSRVSLRRREETLLEKVARIA